MPGPSAPVVYWVNQFSVPPDQPGGTRHYDMAAELRRQGVDVRLVASDLSLISRTYSRRRSTRDIRAVREMVETVPFVWLYAGSYRQNDWRRIASMVAFGASTTVFLLRAAAPSGTVFIGSSPHLFAALGTFAAARLRRVPFVFEVRDLWPESYVEVSGNDRSPMVRIMQWIADFLYRRAEAIVVLAEPNKDRIAARGADPRCIHYVPNGVDLAAATADTRRSVEGPVTFAYTGAHGPANGLDVVIRACAELERRGRDGVRVLLVGDGPAKAELQELARSLNVTVLEFRDPVPKNKMPALLSSVDVGLMVLAPVDLFSYGVSPNKLFDYLAADLAVVTNVPGLVTDIVDQSGAGVSCAPGDPVALADAMTAMADALRADPTAYSGGRDFVAKHYDRRMLAGRLRDVLTGLSARLSR